LLRGHARAGIGSHRGSGLEVVGHGGWENRGDDERERKHGGVNARGRSSAVAVGASRSAAPAQNPGVRTHTLRITIARAVLSHSHRPTILSKPPRAPP
jgi:hypothetical protein